jgi:hypothetical protein
MDDLDKKKQDRKERDPELAENAVCGHAEYIDQTEIPNAVTRQAIQDAANDVDMQVSHSMAEFKKAMEED